MFLSALKVLIALIRPIVPIEMRSSIPIPVLSNFFAMKTTRRRLCSIRVFLAPSESKSSLFMTSDSSAGDRGGGRVSEPPI